MNQYLRKCKTIVDKIDKFNEIFVVLGNESCDLDSVVCPLIYGYFLHKTGKHVLPVLNICKDEFPLRTESKYFLEKLQINTHNLIFRNQINLHELHNNNKLKLILVDHHALPPEDKNLEKSVVEIVDHRPKHHNLSWKNVEITLQQVGSCSTLIANKIFENSAIIDDEMAKLLHGTIILDTINFNPEANRFTELDVEMVTKLETDYKILYTRQVIFEELTNARIETSHLTAFQILHRDLKIICKLPIPAVPMLVQDFLMLDNAVDSLREFCYRKKFTVLLVMGLCNRDGKVFRDLAVYSFIDCPLKDRLIRTLIEADGLRLTEVFLGINKLVLYSQGNVTMSRKHIVPILVPVLEKCNNILRFID